MNYGQRLAGLKLMSKIFASVSLIFPLLIVPFLAYKFNNWWLLFGVLISFFGSLISFGKGGYILIALATIFCVGFWMRVGFNIHQYVAFYYFCLLIGFWTCKTMQEYNDRTIQVNREIDDFIQYELTEGETGKRIKDDLELKMKELREKKSNNR